MSANDLPELPSLPQLVAGVANLSELFEQHLQQGVAIGMDRIGAEDHLVIASLRRALDNIAGIIVMAEQKNLFCGMPIVRFQIDTAMTLFGRKLVADIDNYVAHMLKGKKRGKYRAQDGQEMSDAYLHKKLTSLPDYDYASDLYSETSAYVHFSTHHLHRVLDFDLYKQKGELAFRSYAELVVGWPDDELCAALSQFILASMIILHECERWERDKGLREQPESTCAQTWAAHMIRSTI